METNEIGFNEAAHAFFNKGLSVYWRRLAYDVYYYYAEEGLYVVKELNSVGFDTFTFIKAHSLDELKTEYFGTSDI